MIFENARVIVCVGSGGVGKTTTASALALAAAKKGKRVLALTIDPAQRLKSTLGLKDQDHSEIRSFENGGKLSAGIVNSKRVFDEFVLKANLSSQTTEKIFKNRLYVELSTTLSGSQEFTALEALLSSVESGKYDLVVLDTPPTKHAIDFLNAPEKLNSLFNEGVSRWFRSSDEKKSLFSKVINSGTTQVLKALETITGGEFMKELADFFKSIQEWQPKIEQRILQVHNLLVHPQTQFVLVTSFDEAKLQEADYFSREIRKSGYRLTHTIINKAKPLWLEHTASGNGWDALFGTYQDFYRKKTEQLMAFAQHAGQNSRIIEIPELDQQISDLQGVELVAEYLNE